ncbi:Nephrocystin-1 [Mactra antiquata]
MGKEPTPLEKVTKDADSLKKQIDKIVKESIKNANNKKLKDKEIKLKANFRSCYELIPQVNALLQRAEELNEEDEGPKVKNFETKKKKEVDRITAWQTSIDDTMKKLLPDEEGEAYRKELKKELGGESEEEEEEEGDDEKGDDAEKDDDEDEDEEDDEEDDEDGDEEEGDETAGETLGDTEKSKATVDDDDEEIEEEVEEEEVEEEETDVEDEDDEDEEETQEKVIESKKAAKTAAAKADDDDEDDEDDDEDEEDDDEEDDDEEDDEEDDDEEGEDEGQTTMEITTSGRLFEALYDYKGDQEGDLSFKAGEILTILTIQEDGWWEAENEKGEKGNVPSTYLRMHNKYKDVQQDDEEEEGEEEEVEEEDDGDGDGKKKKPTKKKSGKQLWSGIRKAVNETSVTDVLHAMGAVPSGFRVSTLGQKFNLESIYLMKNYLAPKLSVSNFSYKDLFFDPNESKIRPKLAREQRIITISNCRQIPVPSGGLEVKSRHVRMCLFDGQNILSNIHTVRVASVDREQRTWSFSTRVNDLMDTYQHAEVFIRTSNIVPNIGILFELCVSYLRPSTNERGEFSCGWTHLRLEDENTGQPIPNKTYDLYMSGGTPYEKGVEVDPSISRRTTTNSFMSMLSGNKQPRLTVKLAVPKREQKELIDTLPDTVIGNVSLLQMYSFYRQILADTLIRDRLDMESTEIIHSPFLATFPMIADHHDMMKLLRESWIEKLRSIRKAEMRDAEYMKDTFKKVLMESVYPLVNSASFPAYKSGDSEVEEARHAEIEKFKHNKLAKRGILALLLSSDMTHKPVDMKEVSFSAIGPYCLTQKTVPPVTVES